jgi:single-stranded DNA-specific DHH superfamily exonuclease
MKITNPYTGIVLFKHDPVVKQKIPSKRTVIHMPSEKYLALQKIARECTKEIIKHSHVHCVSHIDADGITSAAIIARALERAG